MIPSPVTRWHARALTIMQSSLYPCDLVAYGSTWGAPTGSITQADPRGSTCTVDHATYRPVPLSSRFRRRMHVTQRTLSASRQRCRVPGRREDAAQRSSMRAGLKPSSSPINRPDTGLLGSVVSGVLSDVSYVVRT